MLLAVSLTCFYLLLWRIQLHVYIVIAIVVYHMLLYVAAVAELHVDVIVIMMHHYSMLILLVAIIANYILAFANASVVDVATL
jgi:hypothetical protein